MPFPDCFPVARYRLEFQTETAIAFPEYAGSTLRGAFGHALRRAVCITREPVCPPCALYRTCTYPAVFEPPAPLDYTRRILANAPGPFVVEPPAWGERQYQARETLSFHLVLIGAALKQLPLLVLAWQRALAKGVGKSDGTARLLRVCLADQDESLSVGSKGELKAHAQMLAIPQSWQSTETVSLTLQTPLRLQQNGQVVRLDTLTPHALLMSLVRRIAYLAEQCGQALDVDFAELNRRAAAIEGEKQLQWRDWTRFSNRQRQEMVLGGAIGRWTLRGELTPFMPFLYLGQWLHAGKNASFGLGKYVIETIT